MSNSNYGMQTAARSYYGKDLKTWAYTKRLCWQVCLRHLTNTTLTPIQRLRPTAVIWYFVRCMISSPSQMNSMSKPRIPCNRRTSKFESLPLVYPAYMDNYLEGSNWTSRRRDWLQCPDNWYGSLYKCRHWCPKETLGYLQHRRLWLIQMTKCS